MVIRRDPIKGDDVYMPPTEDVQGTVSRNDDVRNAQDTQVIPNNNGVMDNNAAFADVYAQYMWRLLKPVLVFMFVMIAVILVVSPYIAGTWYGYTIVYGLYASFVIYALFRK